MDKPVDVIKVLNSHIEEPTYAFPNEIAELIEVRDAVRAAISDLEACVHIPWGSGAQVNRLAAKALARLKPE